MGRRSYSNVQAARSDERQSIGDQHISTACTNLSLTARKMVALMTKYEHTREFTLPMLFADNDLAKASQVRGIIDPGSDIESYCFGKSNEMRATLTIDFQGALVPTIMPERLTIHQERAKPLLAYIEAVRAIHLQFEEVKAVLRWLNRNATPGAIRYFWPTAMKLCPNSTAFVGLDHVPARYSMPPGINDRMQMLKDAAACVVSSLMMPDDKQPNGKGTMWLTFDQTQIVIPNASDPTASYTTDSMTYNL